MSIEWSRLAVLCKQAREDLSIREFIEGSDIAMSSYYRAEKGKPISAENLVRIAHWIGINPGTLINNIDATARLKIFGMVGEL